MLKWALAIMIMHTGVGRADAQDRIRIVADWGSVNVTLADNPTARSLLPMLPVSIDMRDHLRQEKTGFLPAPLVESGRSLQFSGGTIGLWSANHFVVYYRDGRVPQPGIILLGKAEGDVSFFDRPGNVTIRIEQLK